MKTKFNFRHIAAVFAALFLFSAAWTISPVVSGHSNENKIDGGAKLSKQKNNKNFKINGSYTNAAAVTAVINAAPPAVVVSESVMPPNGVPDPDETVTMSFPLQNAGTSPTNNLVATLLPGGGVNAPSGSQSYGALNPGDLPEAREFTFVPSGNCGDNITATFQLQDGETDLGTVTFTIQLGTAGGSGTSFGSNTNPIIIPGTGTGSTTGAPANPYPSTINIAGVFGTVTKVTATLNGFNHAFPNDVDVLLVGPGGQKVLLMSDVGGGTDAVNAVITFDDTAPPIGATVVSGTFRPTNIGATDIFPAPAPALPYSSSMSVFNGINANGEWRLFVIDDASVDAGNISGGWSLTIEAQGTAACAVQACTLGVADVTKDNDSGFCGAFVTFPSPTITGSCGVVTANPTSGSFFPVGISPVIVTGTRQDGSTTSTTFNVTVNDTEAPTISNASVDKPVLTPPDHRMVDVNVSYTVSDNCTAPGAITRTLSVTSNEPLNGAADGNTEIDWVIVNENLVRLRAERAGIGTGRVYTITITATDAHGNTTTQNVTVSVPHNQ